MGTDSYRHRSFRPKPAFILRRALDARCPETAAWAWDELGVRDLADPSRMANDHRDMDRVDARK